MMVINRMKRLCSIKSSPFGHFFCYFEVLKGSPVNPAPTSVLHYKGKFTFERIGILLNELKNKKDAYRIEPIDYKKLLTLMIEILENVLKYSDHFEVFVLDHQDYQPEFELQMDGEGFILISRNPVKDKDVENIAKRIDKINTSNDEELKKIYRDTITNGVFTEKGGAGLGFIEMAKITSNSITYSFERIDKGFSYFEIRLHINYSEEDHE